MRGRYEDIYDEKQVEEMLENGEITEAEYSFMLGREKGPEEEEGSWTEKTRTSRHKRR